MTVRLVELAVTDLGTIESTSILFGEGLTALTGETGAGKTMIVGAIDLLLGGRSEASMVRAGAVEAVVEGRFEVDDDELVVSRVVPHKGRSRAYVNGRMATATTLAAAVGGMVDMHGQHAHQSLLSAATQRDALDVFGRIDLTRLREVRAERAGVEAELASTGGDAGTRYREMDLLRYQLGELEAAALDDPDEDEALDREQDLLSGALHHREAAGRAAARLAEDGAAIDLVGAAVAEVDGRGPFQDLTDRLRGAQAELSEAAAALRELGESIEDDPARLAAVVERRQLLVELRRKYGTAPGQNGRSGSGTLADVIEHAHLLAERLAALQGHEERAAELESRLAALLEAETREAAVVGNARRRACGPLAEAVETHLAKLAMRDARLRIEVGPVDPGDDVRFLLAANRGAEPAPLQKVASGGELARSMLALRLVLSEAPPILVFDEVDAGIGGKAALAVGRALADLGQRHQVLVVTHLPQVAAYADSQVHISKATDGTTTTTTASVLDDQDRIAELSRMLAGAPHSERVREAAVELLATATRDKTR